jgi:predicted O-methyltransferase YrrM
MSKINTIINLLADPLKWPRFRRLICEKLGRSKIDWEDSSKFSLEHCEKIEASSRDVFSRIFPNMPYREIEREYSAEIQYAKEQVAEAKASGISMGGGGEFELIYNLVLASKSQKIVETGVAYGWSSFGILAALHSMGTGHLWSTNLPYPGMVCDRWVGCVVPEDWKHRWSLLSGKDYDLLPAILQEAGRLDCAFYDSAKSYAARRRSYPILWSALKVGGLFFSDDICDNMGFFHFAKCVREQPIVIRHDQASGKTKYIGILMKKNASDVKNILF